MSSGTESKRLGVFLFMERTLLCPTGKTCSWFLHTVHAEATEKNKVFIFLGKYKTDEQISDGDNTHTGQRVVDQNAQSNLFFSGVLMQQGYKFAQGLQLPKCDTQNTHLY